MIINDDSSIISKWSFKLINDPRAVIYDCNRFIIQATGEVPFIPTNIRLGLNVIKLGGAEIAPMFGAF